MACPEEFAAQVDAAVGCSFSSENSPVGNWGRNGLGNVFLTEPDSSFHYFNADGGYYHQKVNEDHEGPSIYVSPTRDRYYNASPQELKADSHIIGKYWETGKEKVCYRNRDGSLSLTIRKYIETEGLPRHRVAVYMDSLGAQRLVEVNERGVYGGQNQRLVAEIRFWLANNVPVGHLDGPLLVDDLPIENRFVTPPPRAQDVQGQHSDDTDSSNSDFDNTSPSSHDGRGTRGPSPATGHIKEEEQHPAALEAIPRACDVASQDTSPVIKAEVGEVNAVLSTRSGVAGSGRACMSKLLSARKSPEVKHGRITKNVATPVGESSWRLVASVESVVKVLQQQAE